MDTISIIAFHKCPLTILEKKYSGKTGCEKRHEFLTCLDIQYHCNDEYEKQIELMINAWRIVVYKILVIVLLQTFRIGVTYNV